jgi:hypothetical protein
MVALMAALVADGPNDDYQRSRHAVARRTLATLNDEEQP